MNLNIGDRFGKLVIERVVSWKEVWVICDCGTRKSVCKGNLKAGRSKSCGCTNLGRPYQRFYLSCKPELKETYNAWSNMKSRCLRKSHRCWDNYGGRGISVCSEWMQSFPNFLSEMGVRPDGYSLERVDVNGNYCKENCKWIPLTEQSYNTTKTRMVLLTGERLPLKVAARKAGINPSTVNARRKRNGITAQEALDHFIKTGTHKPKLSDERFVKHA